MRVLNSVSSALPQCDRISFAATGGALAAGTVLGWSSPIKSRVTGGEWGFEVSADEWDWIVSLVTLGAALSCAIIGTAMQCLGRKMTILLLACPFGAGYLCVILGGNAGTIMAGRFLLGMAGGAFCVASPTYTAEIAQADIRGTLGVFFQLMLVIGILLSYVLGEHLSINTFNVLLATIPLASTAVFAFMPESPVYLVSRGRNESAVQSLQWLRGAQYDCAAEIAELQAQCEESRRSKASLASVLRRPSTLKAVSICFGLMFFQQMCGINAVIFFSKDIFDAAATGMNDGSCAILVGAIQVVAVFASALIVDRAGRRLLLLLSIVLMSVCTLLLGAHFYIQALSITSEAALAVRIFYSYVADYVPVVSLCLFIFAFSIGFGPIPWMMLGELFANEAKAVAGSAAGAANWTFAFLITFSFVDVKIAFGNGPTFWAFAGLSALGAIFVGIFVPETKGKSLAEIQEMLEGAGGSGGDIENGKEQ